MGSPNEGIKFRILSNHVGRMLCQTSGKTSVGGFNVGTQDAVRNVADYDYADGTWFTLRRCNEAGWALIEHSSTGYRLYANYERDENGLINPKSMQYDDQKWQLRWHGEAFQLVNKFGNKKYFIRDHPHPHIGYCDATVFNYADQFFKCYYEEAEVASITFDLQQATFLQGAPRLVEQQIFRNSTVHELSHKFSAEYKHEKTHTWEHTGGYTFPSTVPIMIKSGIPQFASAGSPVRVGFPGKHPWKQDATITTESADKKFELVVPVKPEKRAEVKLFLHEERCEVPYEMTVCFKSSGVRVTSTGVWRGVNNVKVKSDVRDA